LKALFFKAKLYILAFPLLLIFTGAAMNQAVIAANHDKFPVMLNEHRAAKFIQNHKECFLGLVCVDVPASDDGMLDEVHCLMTPSTHLNFLADWIDLHHGMYSPGDLLLMLGDYLLDYAPLVWALLMIQLALTGNLRNS